MKRKKIILFFCSIFSVSIQAFYFQSHIGLGLNYYISWDMKKNILGTPFSLGQVYSFHLGTSGKIVKFTDKIHIGLSFQFLPLYSKETGKYKLFNYSIPLWFEYQIFKSHNWKIFMGTEAGVNISQFTNLIEQKSFTSYNGNFSVLSRLELIKYYPNNFWIQLKQNQYTEFKDIIFLGWQLELGVCNEF